MKNLRHLNNWGVRGSYSLAHLNWQYKTALVYLPVLKLALVDLLNFPLCIFTFLSFQRLVHCIDFAKSELLFFYYRS